MALNTFNGHISELGEKMQELLEIIEQIDGIMDRHTANGYSGLATGAYTGRSVDKTQYDAATSSMADLVDTWRPTHRTNINAYLYEIPAAP
jgi:hypothetical protein